MKGHIRIHREGRPIPEYMRDLAEDRMQRVSADNPWMADLGGELNSLVMANASRRSKYRSLRKIAVRINDALKGQTACGVGCSSCCNISVVLSDAEAAAIGAEIGVAPKKVAEKAEEELVEQAFGVPCTFLKEGQCSIYENRPLACVLHHSLGPDASMCDPEVRPEDSYVPTVNLQGFWLCYAMVMSHDSWGDIRDFFPNGQKEG